MVDSKQTEIPQREAYEWIVRLTSGHATAVDAEAVRLWCGRSAVHAQAFAEATLLWETLGPVAQGAAMREPAVPWLGARGVGRRAFLGGAIAAAAGGLMIVHPPAGLWPSLSEMAADYRTGAGERRRLAIDDGISVELNTRTSLAVGGTRRLELIAGEMAVSTRGLAAPLEVAVSGGKVFLAEASADIRCDRSRVGVICLRGAVHIAYRAQTATLGEHQQIAFEDHGLGTPSSVDSVTATAWQEGRLVYRGVPLAQVVEEVNRYRRARILVANPELGRRTVVATIPVDRTDELIGLIQRAFGASVTNLPGGIVVVS